MRLSLSSQRLPRFGMRICRVILRRLFREAVPTTQASHSDFSTQPPGVCRTPTTRQVPCGTLKMQDSKRGTLRTGRSCRTEPAIWWSDDKPTNKCVSHCDKRSGERGRESRGRGAPAAATRARMRRRPPNPKTPLEATAQAAARGGRLAAPASSRWGLVFPKLVPRLGLRTVISPGCEHRDSGSRWRGLVGRPLDQGQRWGQHRLLPSPAVGPRAGP